MNFLAKIFTWWNGATIGTHLWSARNGEHVGTDAQGNKYFRSKKAAEGARERRWVIYEGANDASRVPSEWHGWLHGSFDDVPSAAGADLGSRFHAQCDGHREGLSSRGCARAWWPAGPRDG